MELAELGRLARSPVDEVETILRDTDPDELVRSVRRTPDADLHALIARDDLRAAATDVLLGRIGDFVLASRLDGVAGVARLEIAHAGAVDSVHTLRVADGRLEGIPRVAPDRHDVRLRTGAADLIRLLSGERNAGIEYLAARLDIEGDAELALSLGGMFPSAAAADGTPVPVDPRALDPVEVAGVLGTVDTAHLRSVLASGMRSVILDEIFTRLPAYVNAHRAVGHDLTIGFRLTGRADDGVDRYVIRLTGGTAQVLSGDAADAVGREARHATVTCAAHDFLRLATGHLGAVTGVLKGQLKVRGDKAAALRLATAFDIPSAVA